MRALVPPVVLAAVLAAALATGCAAAPVAPPPLPAGRSDVAAREALRRFAHDLRDRRFPDAYALMSARWRGAYTPARLAADWEGAGPIGRDETDRVLALLDAGAPLLRRGDALELDVGPGRAARLVPEDGGWRVDALE